MTVAGPNRWLTYLAALTLVLASRPAYAQRSAWYEGFEEATPSWRVAGADTPYQVERQERASTEAHTGNRSELIAVRAEQGTCVYVAHEVGRPLVIDELLPTVWIKSDRSGIQFLVHVVLPRSTDKRTGRPVDVLLPGTSYTQVGAWQQLRVSDVPRQLARQVRLLRTELGPQLDDREAYVERVVLNAYGGQGLTTLWIDDLDIGGYVARVVPDAPAAYRSATAEGPVAGVATGGPGVAPPVGRVVMNGSTLLVDGKPMFPRALEYRGEPLALVKQLGFNAVWLREPPSPELLGEAERHSLWLIAPPRRPAGLDSAYGAASTLAEFGPEYERVLAWHLGTNLGPEQLEAVRRWSDQVRLAGRKQNRPLVGQPASELRTYSRYFDCLIAGRMVAGTSLDLNSYRNWLRSQPLLARPGTTFWITIPTQLPLSLGEQLAVLDARRPAPLALSAEQLRLLAQAVIAAGAKGILFESCSSLAATDDDTRRRALAVELTNLALSLVEPWCAAGTLIAPVESPVPEVVGATLRTDRARLILPCWLMPGGQYVPGQSAANNVSLVAPGVPESSVAYELTPGGIRPLRQKRVIGGTQVTLDEFGIASLVLLAHDPAVISAVSRSGAALGQRAAEVNRQIVSQKLQFDQQTLAELAGRPKSSQDTEWLGAARQSLEGCDVHLAARQYQQAWLAAERGSRPLRLLERACWDGAMAKGLPAAASPGAASFGTLPWHWRLVDRLKLVRPGPPRLAGGDFEDLSAMLAVGWQHFPRTVEQVRGSAELLPAAAHGGRFGLRLIVQPVDPKLVPNVVEVPVVSIVSPPVPVEAGELLEISGWVRVPKLISGSVDGLLISDSLSGELGSQRIGQTGDWRQFKLYRPVPRGGNVSVSFSLCGLGEAWIDDVTIQPLLPAGPGR